MVVNTSALTVAQSMKVAIPKRTLGLPESSTLENSSLFSRGITMPTDVAASMETSSIRISDGEI